MRATRTARPGPPGGADGSLSATADRLMAEFAEALDRPTIIQVLRACHRDLAGAPAAALPELVERLARVDLTDLTHDTDTTDNTDTIRSRRRGDPDRAGPGAGGSRIRVARSADRGWPGRALFTELSSTESVGGVADGGRGPER